MLLQKRSQQFSMSKRFIDIEGLFHSTAELAGKVEEQVNESIGLSKGLIGKAVHSGLNRGL